ncbi:MAG TPA: S46 family peptidase, partial [Polyangiaceae bacterium]|nr:S46 family peptidase [Polyangiaceae bacterium]
MLMARFVPPASLAFFSILVACGGDEANRLVAQPCPTSAPITSSATAAPDAGGGETRASFRLPDNDEGMWTVDHFPTERLEKLHGWAPSKEWLEQVSHRAVRVGNGCSGSIISADGLVMTNHHCARGCVSNLSKKGRDYLATGFYAKTEKEEVQCPGLAVDQLTGITDVTARMNAATKDAPEAEFHAKQSAVKAAIEKECATGPTVRCDVVTLYHGGQYHLYKYRRYKDTRLVLAPESSIAFFGGDPDNFNFPRYDFDISLLRVYDSDKPAKTSEHFRFAPGGPKEGEPIFIVGHPGGTQRSLTVAQLEYVRDVELPENIEALGELRGLLTEYGARSAEAKRISNPRLFGTENALKVMQGRYQSLADAAFFGKKVEAERALRAYTSSHPELQAAAGAWDAIARAQNEYRNIHLPYTILERASTLSRLFEVARTLVRAADERAKPNDQRLAEYAEARLPRMQENVLSAVPVYDDFEAAMLEHWLMHMRAMLGPDDPAVKNALGKESPGDLARRLVHGTKLKDANVRKALFEGGKAAVDKSDDPLIQFMRRIDGDARAVRKTFEDKVEGVITKNTELVARVQFAVYGDTTYPDATGTLRVAYGELKGWEERGKPVTPVTTFGGAFDRATGKEPFDLPKRWLDARAKLDLTAPFNFSSTNDIIGGNS